VLSRVQVVQRSVAYTYFSSVIRLVSIYPLPLVMRYRYMPLATPAPLMLVLFHTAS